jgi:hypothetical protein
VWRNRKSCSGGTQQFFYVALSHDSLGNFYQLNFALMQHHKYSLTELDNMIPFERDIYVTLLKNYLEEEQERLKQQQR